MTDEEILDALQIKMATAYHDIQKEITNAPVNTIHVSFDTKILMEIKARTIWDISKFITTARSKQCEHRTYDEYGLSDSVKNERMNRWE